MFRAACDNSVTTSQPASPPTANLRISKCPPASPICAKPVRTNPLHCPTTARQRLTATHHDTPSIGIPTPCGTAVFFNSGHSRLPQLAGLHGVDRSETDHLDLVSIDVGTQIQGHRIQ